MIGLHCFVEELLLLSRCLYVYVCYRDRGAPWKVKMNAHFRMLVTIPCCRGGCRFAEEGSATRHWIVLDGPVDALWIETMNTVLDDNRMLCLMSGEVIPMPRTMNLLFEVQNLKAASPATVSRCGMVYMDPSELGWRSLLRSWLNELPESLSRFENDMLILVEWCVVLGIPSPPCVWSSCSFRSWSLFHARACLPPFQYYICEGKCLVLLSMRGPVDCL